MSCERTEETERKRKMRSLFLNKLNITFNFATPIDSERGREKDLL